MSHMPRLEDSLLDKFNFRLRVYEADGRLHSEQEVHNVLTDTGRRWLLRALAGANLSVDPPTPLDTAKPKYMGFGVGGILQTDPQFANTQVEQSAVQWVEDPVPFVNPGTPQYLKQIESISDGSRHFPTDFILRHICKVLETEITFTGATTGVSGVVVNTQVPVSEAGLYLSTADPNYTPGTANEMICYANFDPVDFRPGLVGEAVWEFRD